jgi:small subunit ribosomal protein S15
MPVSLFPLTLTFRRFSLTETRIRPFRPEADSSGSLGAERHRQNMLTPDKKKKVIEKYKMHATDTGSPQVQIAILTEEVKDLTEHLKTHKKDFSSRRGLIKKVSERRRLMKYLKREDAKAYDDLMAKMG